jgi:predicted  nucleic acid-binding Zn-ribbon protein
MTLVLFKNLNGDELGRRHLPPARRKVGTIVRRCARRDVPFIVSVHKPFTPQTPCNNTVATRRAHKKGLEHRSWDRWVPAPEDVVVVTYLPEGGRGGQTALKIASSIAALTLMLVNPALSLGLISAKTATALQIASVLVIGGTSIAMALSRPKSQQPIYGVTGGGNLPRPNSPIPVGYGTCWRVPDLSQPDYSRYENREDTILLKRGVIGQGKYRLKRIRVGTTTFWSGDIEPNGGVVTSGITSPFPGCRFELIYGQASTLVPSSVISSPNVTGQAIPLSSDPDPILGPFPVNPVNTTINRIQVDFSTPSGYSRNGHETTQDLWFEYAPIDDAGNPIGPWQTLYRTSAPFFANRHLRFSQTITVSAGRYAVRARNNRAKIDDNDNCNYAWDGLRGFVPDTIVREHVTEIAMEIRSSKGLGQTAFADVQVEVERVGLVWNGTAFVEGPIRKCLDCFVDMIRDPYYGLGEQASMIDLAKVHAYKTAVTEFDTFDGFINGPVAAAEAMATILLPMRAEPTMVGAGYTFTRDEPSPVRRHLFTRRQIVRNSLSLSYKPQADDGSAHFIVQFDDGGDYRRPNSAEKSMGIPSRTPRIVKVPGVSSYQHAHHLATWMAAAGYCRRKTASFRTELDARLISRGDPIGLDVWFVRETKVAGITAFSGTSLTIDVDVDIEAGDHAILRDRKGREWGPVPVSQGASSRNVVLDETACALEEADTGLSLAQVIGSFNADRCSIRIGPPARLGEQFLVRSISNQENLQAQIEAVVDSASVYAELNAPIPPQSPLTWGLLPSESPAILSLTASCERHDSILMVKWSARAEAGADSYEFQIAVGSDDADWQPLASGPSPIGQSPMPYLSTEVACYIRGRAFGSTGVPGNWLVSAPFTTPKPIVVATDAEPGVIRWDAFDTAVRERVEAVEQAASDAIAAAIAAANSVQDIIGSLSGDVTRAETAGARIGVQINQRLTTLSQALAHAIAVSEDMRGALGDLGWERRGPGGASRFRAVDTINNGLTALSTTVEMLAGRVDTIVAASGEGLEELDAEISVIRQTLDALEGLYEALVTTVNGTTGSVAQLQLRMDAVESTITLLATKAELGAVEDRLEAAELQLAAGTVTIETITALRQSQAVASQTLAELLARFQSLSDAQWEQAAATRFRLDSRIDDQGRSIATLQVDLAALTANTAATFASLTTSIADQTSALTAQITALEAVVYTGPNSNTALSSAITAANAARADGDAALAGSISTLSATVNTKSRTFVAGSAPTATAVGDIWFHTGENNRQYVWNGSSWVARPDNNKNSTSASGTAPSSPVTGDIWIDTSQNNRVKRWNGSTWVDYTDTRLTTAQADISTLQSTKVDAAGATAIAQTEVNAALGDVTANGLFKVAAATTPSGATSAAKLLVKAADSGNYADAGIEMVAIAGGGGSPQGYLVLVGNRIYRRPSGGGAPILMVDSEGRFVGTSLTPGATIQVLPYDRDVSTGYVNVGVGSTTGGGSNSWREEKIGDMSLIANTAAVIGGAGSILPILTTMEMAVDMTINYSFGSVLAQPILGVRLIARPVGGGADIIIMDRVAPPSNVSYGGGANNWLWRWGSNEHDPKVSNSVRALPAGDYEIYLAWRWSYTPVSWSESAYTVRLSGNFSVLALIR